MAAMRRIGRTVGGVGATVSRLCVGCREGARPGCATPQVGRSEVPIRYFGAPNGPGGLGAAGEGGVEVVGAGAGETRDHGGGDAGLGAGVDQGSDGSTASGDTAPPRRLRRPPRARPRRGAPRRRSARRARRRCRARPPRGAWSSSRQTATGRSGSSSASTASDAATRRGDSKATSVSASPANSARSSPALRGRKPAKRQRSAGSALATSAAMAADGPGSTSTASPRGDAGLHEDEARVADQAACRRRTPAPTTAPPRIRSTSSPARARSLCSW